MSRLGVPCGIRAGGPRLRASNKKNLLAPRVQSPIFPDQSPISNQPPAGTPNLQCPMPVLGYAQSSPCASRAALVGASKKRGNSSQRNAFTRRGPAPGPRTQAARQTGEFTTASIVRFFRTQVLSRYHGARRRARKPQWVGTRAIRYDD